MSSELSMVPNAKRRRLNLEDSESPYTESHRSGYSSTEMSSPRMRHPQRTLFVGDTLARASRRLERDGDTLHNIHVDFGTSKASISWAEVARGETDPRNVYTSDLTFDSTSWRIPSLVVLVPDINDPKRKANLVLGKEAEDLVKLGNVHPKSVWRRIKQSRIFVDPEDKNQKLTEDQRKDLRLLHDSHKEALQQAQQYEILSVHLPLDEQSQTIKLQNMGDVIRCFLKFVLQKGKIKLRTHVRLTPEEFERNWNNKWRFGVAVPDNWSPEVRNEFYGLLLGVDDSGSICEEVESVCFPARYQLTSEGKSACAKSLQARLREELNKPSLEQDIVVQQLSRRIFINIDIGAGTADISTLRLDFSGNNQIVCRLISMIDSLSCYSGGNVVNQTLKQRLSEIFKNRMEDVVSSTDSETLMSSDEFLDHLDQGIEEAKAGFEGMSPNHRRLIAYYGAERLQSRKFLTEEGEIELIGKSIWIPDNLLAQCFEKQLEELLKPNGVLEMHLAKVFALSSGLTVEIILSGGGSQPPYICGRLREELESRNVMIYILDNHDHSPVARGGVMILTDPNLSMQHMALESYGVAIAAEFDMDNYVHRQRHLEMIPPHPPWNYRALNDSIEWLSQMGDLSTAEHRSVRWTYSIDLGKIEHPLYTDGNYDFEWPVYKTCDKNYGSQSGWNVNTTAEIKKIGTLRLPIDRSIARELGSRDACDNDGFIRFPDGRWILEFEVRLTHFWSGMIHTFKVEIPQKGKFVDGVEIYSYELHLQGRTVHGGFIGDHNEECV